MPLVYIATSPSGKHYVGQTVDLKARKRQHRFDSRKDVNQDRLFCRALRKYGNRMRWAVLADGLSPAEVGGVEEAFIRLLGTLTPGGYNLTPGGERTVHAPQTRERIAAKLRGRKRPPSVGLAISAANTGRKHSLEHNLRTSEALRRRVRKPESYIKASASKRILTAAEAANVCMLHALGATQTLLGHTFAVDRTTISNILKGSYGWRAVFDIFYAAVAP